MTYVRTWADAWGIWHATVPATASLQADRRKARAAINAELKARGAPGRDYVVDVVLVATDTTPGRLHYVEA